MDSTIPIIIWFSYGLITFLIITFFTAMLLFYKKAQKGKALVRTGFRETKIATDRGIFVVPFLHKVETVSLSTLKN